MSLSHPRPSKLSVDSFQRQIRALNDNYRLELGPAHPHEQPGLYERLQQNFFSGKLERLLGRFYVEAQKLQARRLSEAQVDPESRSITTSLLYSVDEERAELRHCLVEVLNDQHGRSSRQRTSKRASEDDSEIVARKSRTMPRASPGIGAIDSIPIRSNSPMTDYDHPLPPASSRPPPAPSCTHQDGSIFSRSTNSSRLSFVSHPSTTVSQDTPASDLSSYEHKDQDVNPPYTQEFEALNEPFSLVEVNDDVTVQEVSEGQRTPTLAADTTDNVSTLSSETYASLGFDNIDLDQILRESVPVDDGAARGNLRRRLIKTWPILPNSFADAPLAVAWELMRIAIYCKVDLQDADIAYNRSWCDQHQMRRDLQQHALFQARLPPACEERAWQAAIDNFANQDKSVVLAVDLTYSSNSDGPMFDVKLQPLHLRLSHRLSRRFGSDRFLEVSMPSPTNEDQYEGWMKKEPDPAKQIIRWLCRDAHFFLGRSWIPFFTKPAKKEVKQDARNEDRGYGAEKPRNMFLEQVHFFATNGDQFRSGLNGSEDERPDKRVKISYHELLKWTINIDDPRNMKQPLPKLFSRLALSLSRTSPAKLLDKHQIIHLERDVISPDTNAVMNDGIGRMSRCLARKIVAFLGLDHTPVAFQGRIGSAKGMWIVDVTDDELGDHRDWIETYPSQRKWHCNFDDEHHRTFEVRSWPSRLRPAMLNQQFIPILEAQSRDPNRTRHVIGHYLENSLDELASLKTAIDNPLDTRLWLSRIGALRSNQVFYEHMPFLGGLPEKHEDEVAFLLDSGFMPREMPRIRETLIDIQQKKANFLRDKMNIKVPCSTYAYMVVDFWGVLDEGEVHLSFSTEFKAEDGSFADTLLEDMDILVARSPAHYRSDIQKVRVVSRPQLRKLKDVIVFSTKGKAPLADLLSGGDYDGDIAWVCWDRHIVDNFHNAPPPHQPDFFQEGFLTKLKETTQEVFHSHAKRGYESAYEEFLYRGISFNMRQSLLGRCTKYKERLCYNLTVSCEQASLLSTLVSNLVDQSKQGIIFDKQDWARFCKERLKTPVYWEKGEYETPQPSSKLQKKFDLQPDKTHVLDYLKFRVAGVYIDYTLEDLKNSVSSSDRKPFDPQLVSLYNEYRARATESSTLKAVLKKLTDDISNLRDRWKVDMGRKSPGPEAYKALIREIHAEWVDIRPLKRCRSSKTLWPLRARWMTKVVKEGDPDDSKAFPDEGWTAPLGPWTMLKASATFKLCYGHAYKFAWQMAGLQLAHMKSSIVSFSADIPTRAPVLMTPEMAVGMKPDGKMITTLASRREAARDEVTEVDEDGTIIDDA